MPIPPRSLFAAVALGCVGLLGFGLFLQHYQGIEPCPLCILQRIAFVAAGVIAAAAALHDPAGWGRSVYAGLMTLSAAAGGGVAIRQIWLQHNPPRTLSCGADLEYMMESFPLSQLLPMIFRGSGDCAEVKWAFLGLSIPEWAAACFAGICAIGLWLLVSRRQPQR
ncbi:MAG: disulfide bond formation protein B [Rhodocyclaceae bacterium]